jgi:cytochrome c peroxidase
MTHPRAGMISPAACGLGFLRGSLFIAGLSATACGTNSAVEVESLTESSEAAQESSLTWTQNDFALRKLLVSQRVFPVRPGPPQDPKRVAVGRALFFDKELSGPRNISCATCHHPTLGSADAQSQSRAQGAVGLGKNRKLTPGTEFLPRNALSLWNRGVPEWETMFWDGRLGGNRRDGFFSPAGNLTPQGFSDALSAFAIMPVSADEEMRGFPGQKDRLGNENELSTLKDDDFVQIWDGLAARINAIPKYRSMMKAAFPRVAEGKHSFVDIANALGAFMGEAFTALDSPFDRYLKGRSSALTEAQKRGAALFYGRANCSSCHFGALQTDQGFHNIASPQVGSGRGEDVPLDAGRSRVSNQPEDKFKFRTPSLRNIELEGPFMHNGAFVSLEATVRHHLNPAKSLATYVDDQVEPELRGKFQNDAATIAALLNTVDPQLAVKGAPLTETEIQELLQFLSALTDPSSRRLERLVPETVPSGLPVVD